LGIRGTIVDISLVFSMFTIVMTILVIASITNNPIAYATSTINSTAIMTMYS
jgi:hypothetical protein